MKQLATGLMMYIQDYDETFPRANQIATQEECDAAPGGCWTLSGQPFIFWQQLSQSYIKNFGIMTCPDGLSSTRTRPFYGHYGANRFVVQLRPVSLTGDTPSATMAQIQAAATTYLFMDSGGYSIMPANDPRGLGTVLQPTAAYWYLPGTGDSDNLAPSAALAAELATDQKSGRHSGGVVVAFCDGHVKFMKPQLIVRNAREYAAGRPNAWDPANPN